MKLLNPKVFVILGVITIVAAAVLWMNLAGRASANPLLQAGLPVNGWTVCQDLGISASPAGGGFVQHVVMCHGDGWRIHVYCIEPAKPAPPLNTVCSMVNGTDFWCGDTVQSFREFIVLQTPAPSATVTPSRTPTPTRTFTPTFTSTFTPTFTPSGTSTQLPSNTPQHSSTPGRSITTSKNQFSSQTPPATPYKRPHAGGPGSSSLIVPLGAIGLGAVLLGVAVLRRILRPGSHVPR